MVILGYGRIGFTIRRGSVRCGRNSHRDQTGL